MELVAAAMRKSETKCYGFTRFARLAGVHDQQGPPDLP